MWKSDIAANNIMAAAIYCCQFVPLELQNELVFCSFADNNVNSVGELRHEALVTVWSGKEPFPLCRATQAQ